MGTQAAAELHSSDPALPPPALLPQRARRKSAKAASAVIAAAVKDEMKIPDCSQAIPPKPSSGPSGPLPSRDGSGRFKRSFSRASSHGSALSVSSAASLQSKAAPDSPPTSPRPKPSSSRARSAGTRKKNALSTSAVEYLKEWMMHPDHIEHPYPTEDEKRRILRETGIELKQLTNWFVNNRKRYWKPKVEELRRKCERESGGALSLQDMAAADQVGHTGEGAAPQLPQSNAASDPGEEAVQAGASQGKKKKAPAAAAVNNSKKRKKYSVESKAAPPKATKKARQVSMPPVVADPIQGAKLASHIHTAVTYDDVKRARKTSHDLASEPKRRPTSKAVSEHSSSESEEELEPTIASLLKPGVGKPGLVRSVVSDPLATVSPAFSSTVSTAPSSPRDVDDFDDLGPDYSITPLDDEVAANTAGVPAVAAPRTAGATNGAGVGFCCQVGGKVRFAGGLVRSPSFLNSRQGRLRAALGTTSGRPPAGGPVERRRPILRKLTNAFSSLPPLLQGRTAQPCALCLACHDWNLGTFCPWDLTGIIGDLSAEGVVPGEDAEEEEDAPASAPSAPPGDDDDFPGIARNPSALDCVADVASVGPDDAEAAGVSIDPSSLPGVPQEVGASSVDFMAGVEGWEILGDGLRA
ncbi:hypothetical protein ACHAWF_008150 [Thalassiosira exigua]